MANLISVKGVKATEKYAVFVLQYENQAQVFGKWGTTGLVGRHKFSDVTGKLKLKQQYFIPPRGWEWEEDWFIDPEKAWVLSWALSMVNDKAYFNCVFLLS